MLYGHRMARGFAVAASAALCAVASSCAHMDSVQTPAVKPEVRHYEPYSQDTSGIRWHEWGDEAFSEAREADKLIFLDVSATWCHWCMVMEETVYADPKVIELVNRDFIPVYVDTDRRPDINDRYNQGGWPSIAVLTPDGRVLAGRTTVSADELTTLLVTIDQAYREDRDAVYARLKSRESSIEEAKQELGKDKNAEPISLEMPVKVLRSVNAFVDPEYGGFGGPQKFPLPEIMQFAVYLYPKLKENKEYSPEKSVRLTLDGMASGLLDKVEGGFFRYSTSVDWKSPHYEKLLSTNGDLLSLYMLAYQRTGDKKYLNAGESAAGYMLGVLYDDSTGAFYASQAADEEYYKLDYKGRLAAGAPPVDGSIYADANARAAIGFLDAFRATGNERKMAVGLRAVEYVMARFYDEGAGVRHSKGSSGVYMLSDQVYPAAAALQAYQATGNHRYLEFAMDVAGILAGKFWDRDKGGFFDSYYPDEPEGLLSKRNKPQIENSRAAMLMAELYYITGDKAYRETAARALEPYTPDYVRHSFWAAPFAHAVGRVLEPAYQFIVLGSIYEDGTMDLVAKSYTYADPDRVVVVLDPEKDKDRIAKLGYEYTGSPILYVCSDKACYPPVKPGESLDKVREYIEKGR